MKKNMEKTSRHQQRVWALQILYSLDLKERYNQEQVKLESVNILQKNELIDDSKYYFQRLAEGVVEKKEKLDEIIDEKAIDWKISRMAYIDRNILRLALFEIKEELVPVSVAINEAVEVAKEFGDEKSSSFINGILGKV
jgi:N utilization substance protein B